MDKENDTTKVLKDDLSFIEDELLKVKTSLALQELTKKIAYKKNAGQLSQEVKIYDSACKYEVDDLIYKEYNEPLIVSSKGAEPFQGSIVLKVSGKIVYDSFNCDMLEVDYTGGGIFRKHIDYMKKTKTQVLLPSNTAGKDLPPKILKKEDDPRFSELPMTDKDLKKLEKNIESELSKSDKFFHWKDHWQLKEKQIEIKADVLNKIEDYFQETEKSAKTSDLVFSLFKLKSSDDLYDLHCLSFNYVLEKEFKKKYVFMHPDKWGKWILKDTIDSFLENLPLSTPKARVPSFETDKKQPHLKKLGFPLKIYLTWREILSGGFTLPKGIQKEFSHSREYVFTDLEEGKDYLVYYYPSPHVILGLDEFFQKNNVPQGASLTLDRKDLTHYTLSLKKSKKKLLVPRVEYDPKADIFHESKEEVYTYSLPNKIIFLDKGTLKKISLLYEQRKKLNLEELLILIFKKFGLEGETISLHAQRAFHLVDMLKHTVLDDVEKTLYLSTEFTLSEKKKGLVFYQGGEEIEEEIIPEVIEDISQEALQTTKLDEAPEDILPEIGTVGEIQDLGELEIIEKEEKVEEVKEKKEEVKVKEPPAKKEKVKKAPEVEKPAPAKKGKPARKRKQKFPIEGEKAPRRRKGERKIIEEKIEIEESEMEALIAVKAKEKKEAEEVSEATQPKIKKEDLKAFQSQEPKFGLFADKLKTALDQTKKKEKKKPKKK